METVRLGKTGLLVSRVGIGGIPIQRPTEDEAIRVVRRALDLGITLIDTARGYGESEVRIGKAIEGYREQIVIVTRTHMPDRVTAQAHLEMSLRQLSIDCIDVWQLHNVSSFEKYEQVLAPGGALEAAREGLEAGKIRHIGITSHNLEVALEAVASGHFEVLLFPFNFINNEAVDKLIPLTKKHDVGFTAMKPFAGGRLTDADLVIKYLFQFDNVVPVPGVETVEEVEEIVGLVNGAWDLTPQDRQKIGTIRAELGTKFCQWCGYCRPDCPQQIYIPGVINLRVTHKLWPWDRWFPGHAEDVETAKTCIQCGECEERCPYELPIREMIVEGIEFYERAAAEHNVQRDSL